MNPRRIITIISFIIFSNLSVYAQLDTITVNSNPLDGGIVSGDGVYPFGSIVSVSADPNEGYIFDNWTENSVEVSTDSSYTFISSGNRDLTAEFSKKSFFISTNPEPINGGTVTGDGTYVYGDPVQLEALAAEGFAFVNWMENGAELSTDSLLTFNAFNDRNITANFLKKSYSVSLSALPDTGGTVTGANIYEHGETAEIEAISNMGFTFLNWTENDIEISQDSLFSFAVKSNRDIQANFLINKYQIDAEIAPLNSGTVLGSGEYEYGSIVKLNAIPLEGYSFVNWTENGSEISEDTLLSFQVDQNRSVTANFSLNSYDVTVTANPIQGGVVSGGGTYYHGETVDLSATSVDGYNFLNWTINDSIVSIDSIYSFICKENALIIGNFSRKLYSVALSINPDSAGTLVGEGEYEHGSLVKVEATSNEGWTFENWTENDQIISADSNYSFVIFDNKTLTANYSKKIYSVHLYAEPAEGGITAGEGDYPYDSVVTAVAIPNYGWSFEQWLDEDQVVSDDSIASINVNNNKNLTAVFSKKNYIIQTESSPEIGGITDGDSTYTYGDLVTLIADPDSINGWEFVNWTVEGQEVSKNLIYTFNSNQNTRVVANFKLREYSVEASVYPENSGNVTGIGTYTHGDSVTLSAIPETGWLFANWTDGENNISSDAAIKISVEENKTLIANFAHELYSIGGNAEPSEAGFVSGSGTFYFGQTAVLNPVPNPGWEFVNWMESGVIISSDTVLIFDVSDSREIKAKFQMINYSINCSVNPPDAGFTSGCGFAFYDEEMVLTATSNEGWEFINWTENGEIVSTDIEYLFSVNNNRNIVANFDLISGIESISDENSIPEDYYLSNAYPNPFNPTSKINFGLPHNSSVKMLLSDINGQIVEKYLENSNLPAGNYSININGDKLSSGVYLFIILAESAENDAHFKQVKKLILLK